MPPTFEQLEPRLLLSADLIGSQPSPCVQVPLQDPAIVVDFTQNEVGSQENSLPAMVTYSILSGQASSAGQSGTAPRSEASNLGPVGQDNLTESQSSVTAGLHRQVSSGSGIVIDASTNPALGNAQAECLRRSNCSDEPVAVQAPADASPRGPPLTGSNAPSQIIFIDSAIESSFQLKNAGSPGTAVIVLDAARDGIQQITDVLSAYSSLSAIHIISHGAPGEVLLGTATLSESSLSYYANDLIAWGRSLSEQGDILVYGCSVGAGANGAALVQQLAGLTGADVAASNDPTGPAELGGDWVLEVATGPIKASVAGAEAVVVAHGLLAAGDLDPTFGTAGVVTTSFTPYNDYARAMAIQPDGKIVVAGYTADTNYDFAVARFNTNGSLDSSFGASGKVTTDFGSNTESALRRHSDGRQDRRGWTHLHRLR